MLHIKLTALKEKRGLTNQKIADKSKVPLSTVTRILNGETGDPSYRHIVNIVTAMDGSLDEIEGIERPAEETPDKVIELYEKTIATKDKYIKILLTICLSLVGIFVSIAICYFIYDVLNGHIGAIRY